MILLLLAQMATFQFYVDQATERLGLPPVTVVESAKIPAAAGTDGTRIYIQPIIWTWKPSRNALRHLAYHEVCHIYLRHPQKAAVVDELAVLTAQTRRQQAEANECAFMYVDRRKNYTRKYWKAWMDFTNDHPFDWDASRRESR